MLLDRILEKIPPNKEVYPTEKRKKPNEIVRILTN